MPLPQNIAFVVGNQVGEQWEKYTPNVSVAIHKYKYESNNDARIITDAIIEALKTTMGDGFTPALIEEQHRWLLESLLPDLNSWMQPVSANIQILCVDDIKEDSQRMQVLASHKVLSVTEEYLTEGTRRLLGSQQLPSIYVFVHLPWVTAETLLVDAQTGVDKALSRLGQDKYHVLLTDLFFSRPPSANEREKLSKHLEDVRNAHGLQLGKKAQEKDPNLHIQCISRLWDHPVFLKMLYPAICKAGLTAPMRKPSSIFSLHAAVLSGRIMQLFMQVIDNSRNKCNVPIVHGRRIESWFNFMTPNRTPDIMDGVRQLVERAAAEPLTPVLIIGENGTGKTQLGLHIHHRTQKQGASGAMEYYCSGACQESVFLSEMYGCVKNAFTYVGESDGFYSLHDTLILNDFHLLPVHCQQALLAVVEDDPQSRLVRRQGPSKGDGYLEKPFLTRTRTIFTSALSRKELEERVQMGSLNRDLWRRIVDQGILITLPPLRDRLQDLPVLVRIFAEELGDGGLFETMPEEVKEAITKCRWEGNLRTLRSWVGEVLWQHKVAAKEGNHFRWPHPSDKELPTTSPVSFAVTSAEVYFPPCLRLFLQAESQNVPLLVKALSAGGIPYLLECLVPDPYKESLEKWENWAVERQKAMEFLQDTLSVLLWCRHQHYVGGTTQQELSEFLSSKWVSRGRGKYADRLRAWHKNFCVKSKDCLFFDRKRLPAVTS